MTNPLSWKREHLAAWLSLCAAGGMVGLLFAWLDSPFHTMCSHSVSGEWANCTRAFLGWLPYFQLYWSMVGFGVLIPGLAAYAYQLLRT